MNQVLVSLLLASVGGILLIAVPSEGGYYPGYGWANATRNTSISYPRRNYTAYVPNRYQNTSYYYPRYPRSTPFLAQNGSHNFFWGHRSSYDRLLYFTRVKKASRMFRKVTLDMDFPAKYQRPNGTISYIQVLDQEPAGKGGYVTIVRGGVGYKNVTLHMKSQQGESFDFAIHIYGYGY